MHTTRKIVFETVRAKRQWHTPPDLKAAKLGFRGWHSRGYLPHFDMPGLVQFINYRLADALPSELRQEWSTSPDGALQPKHHAKIEEYLDRGCGNCELRGPRAAKIVEENWLRLDGKDFRLLAWVVMPNHVRLLAEIWQKPQSQLIKDWKGYTARRINRVLSRRGKLWQDDYWDRYIRHEAHLHKVVAYIENNPVKAGLVHSREEWPFGSARFRDEYNRLKPPKP